MLKKLSRLSLNNKTVLARVDFNVPFGKMSAIDDFRIRNALPLIKELSSQKAKVVLLSHLEPDKIHSHPSFEKTAEFIKKKYLKNLIFEKSLKKSVIHKRIKSLKPGGIILLENLRKFPGEENNSAEFAETLASFGDIYINEAFSASHRNHASIVGLPGLLLSSFGPAFLKEMKELNGAFQPERPFLLVLGGDKMETKMPVVKKLLSRVDFVVLAGKIIADFLIMSPSSLKTPKIILPSDFIIERNGKRKKIKISALKNSDLIRDVGSETTETILNLARKSRFILWNGPLGFVERGYVKATEKLARFLAKSKKRAIVGGGDTMAFLDKLGLARRFYFVSTAGGAMLEYLAKGTLPGIEAIKKSKIKK